MDDVREIEGAIRALAQSRRWADVERLGKLALDLATDERDRNALTLVDDPRAHVALAETDVREAATELETPDLDVLPSREPLVETIAIGTREGFMGLVAGCGDSRAQHVRVAAIGYRRVRDRDYLPMIFFTTEEQGRALLAATVRAWPHL